MRKPTITLAAFFLITFFANAQTAQNYQADLESLYEVLQNTPSFKDQVRGNKKKEYENLYDSLKNDTMHLRNANDVFFNLVQLFFPFRDNHLGFYQLPHVFLAKSQFSDSTAIHSYRRHEAFLTYPNSGVNVDSLEVAMQQKPGDSVEGIYYYGDALKVGLYKVAPQQYVGVVLSTTWPNWQKGQIAMRLYEYMPNAFRAVYGHPLWKSLMLYNNEKFVNQSLANSTFYTLQPDDIYKKNNQAKDYVNINSAAKEFQLSEISPSLQYLRLGNFSARPNDMQVSQAFYDQIKNSLKAPHLIVDLRNNSGGAEKVSGKFLDLLKSYLSQGKIYVLINQGTMSRGEIFTLQLRKLQSDYKDRIKIMGQTSMGTIAYGSNYGKTKKLLSGNAQVYITDMRSKGNLLSYERVGVQPDIMLKSDVDWIEQVKQLTNL